MAHASEHAAHGAHDEHDHEITPLSTYLKVFGALLVLTVVTVGVSFIELGAASFAVAMIVAACKASVVAAYFMHLKYDDKLYTLAFFAGLAFVALFFSFTYLDLFTRTDVNLESGQYEYERDRRWQDYAPMEEAAPAEGGAAAPLAPMEQAPSGGETTIEPGEVP